MAPDQDAVIAGKPSYYGRDSCECFSHMWQEALVYGEQIVRELV